MKKEIYKAYETIQPDDAAKERMLSNILNAASGTRNSGMKKNMRRRKKKRRLELAAALALIFIIPAAAAYATDFWGLRSIGIGKISVEEPVSEGTEFIEYEVDIISLQGISNSPEAMACAEWNAFYEEYDKDGAILSEIGNEPTGLDPEYTEAYNCYTQEMADKVDEICEKYQLSKLKDITIADTYEELCSKADIGSICGGGTENVCHSPTGGYFYEDGTLHFEGTATVTGASACTTDYQFSRSVKGSFCPYILNVTDLTAYEQWNYTTACGETALLACSDSKALIIVNKEKSFLVINLLGDIAGGTFDINKNALESLADSFDLSSVN